MSKVKRYLQSKVKTNKTFFRSVIGFCLAAQIPVVVGSANIEKFANGDFRPFKTNQLSQCIYRLSYTLGAKDTTEGTIVESSEYWQVQRAIIHLVEEIIKEISNREL